VAIYFPTQPMEQTAKITKEEPPLLPYVPSPQATIKDYQPIALACHYVFLPTVDGNPFRIDTPFHVLL